MDGIKKLAEKLHNHQPETRHEKSTRTLSLNHKTYLLLFAYCKRKGLVIGDVISELMQILLDELNKNGDLIAEDEANASHHQAARQIKEENKFKKVG